MHKYYWSFNEYDEAWTSGADTIEKCLLDAKLEVEDCDEDILVVYIGIVKQFSPHIYADDIAERLIDQAQDECGDSCDGWLDNFKKGDEELLEEMLNTAFAVWMKETENEPTFGQFDDTWCYNLETGKIIDSAQ